MALRLQTLVTAGCLCVLTAGVAQAGKWGFADKDGGGKNDPAIEVAISIAPNVGAVASLSETQANELYRFDSLAGVIFNVKPTPPLMPQNALGQNQFIRLKFPMNINSKKVRTSLVSNKGTLAATSFLTPSLLITDELGVHIPGIAIVDGKLATGKKVKKNAAGLPQWNKGKKNLLLGKDILTYVSDDGDQDLATISAFKPDADPQMSAAEEIRIRLKDVDGVIVNGFWVVKVDDGTGMGVPVNPLVNPKISSFTPRQPITPPESQGGKTLVETFSSYVIQYTEPMVPESVGWNSAEVKKFNASNPTIPLLYNGNTFLVPNPDNVNVPYYPNLVVTATPNGVSTFVVPFDARPINPNNLSEFVIAPLLDLPGNVDVTLTGLAFSVNNNFTTLPGNPGIQSAATSLYNLRFDDQTVSASMTFRTKGGRAFVNVPVAPQALYYVPLAGSGVGAVNLNGTGYETNAPSVEKLVVLTTVQTMLSCPIAPVGQGSFLFGCNENTFGDRTAANPIGLGGNPAQLGGPTPVKGVNEGSVGTNANNQNPLSIYPEGFETVARASDGSVRLTASPATGSVGDIQVGDFLDKVFFDTLNPFAGIGLHTSMVLGGISGAGVYLSNNISDPPSPNPPPLRLPVGLPPVDIVFSQQKLKQPAFVIEGDEVFTRWPPGIDPAPPYCSHQFARLLMIPDPISPLAGDRLPTFAQNGPWYQSFGFFATFTSPAVPGCGPISYGSRQQIGNFLYVTDGDNGVVQCLNSNNMSILQTIETPDPEGLGMAPDLRTLYVSNFGDDSLSVVDVDPYSPKFHKELTRVKVGSGPRDVAVQPDNEDVFVCNFIGDSISVIDLQTLTVRKTLIDSIKRPWQVVLTQRHTASGWFSGNYQGYIANQGNGNLPVYESGPAGATGVGADDIRWSVELPNSLSEMRYMCYDPGTYLGAVFGLHGGVYVTHRDADTGLAMISRAVWTKQAPFPGALPPVPLPSSVINAPGSISRTFEVVGTWGGPLLQFNQQINPGGQDQVPYDVALADFSASNFFAQVPANFQTNVGGFAGIGGRNSKHPLRGGTPTWSPDRMYVSFPGDNSIAVLDPHATGTRLSTIDNVPVVGTLAPYFDQ